MVSWKFCSHLDDDDDEPEEDDQEIRDKTLPRWQIWLAAERARDRRHWRPWRPDKTKKQTEDDCEDPERQASAPPGGAPATQPPPPPHSHWGSVPRRRLPGSLSTCLAQATLAWVLPVETFLLLKTREEFHWLLVCGSAEVLDQI